jgi:hypothetical protein
VIKRSKNNLADTATNLPTDFLYAFSGFWWSLSLRFFFWAATTFTYSLTYPLPSLFPYNTHTHFYRLYTYVLLLYLYLPLSINLYVTLLPHTSPCFLCMKPPIKKKAEFIICMNPDALRRWWSSIRS